MTDHTTEMAKSALRQVRPWRAGMPWWVILLEGLIRLGDRHLRPDGSQRRQFLSCFSSLSTCSLPTSSAPSSVSARRFRRHPCGTHAREDRRDGRPHHRGRRPDPLHKPACAPRHPQPRLVADWRGRIWGMGVRPAKLGLGLGALVFPVVSALFGLLMLASRLALGPLVLQSLAIVGIVAGIALLGYAFMLYRNARAAPQA